MTSFMEYPVYGEVVNRPGITLLYSRWSAVDLVAANNIHKIEKDAAGRKGYGVTVGSHRCGCMDERV